MSAELKVLEVPRCSILLLWDCQGFAGLAPPWHRDHREAANWLRKRREADKTMVEVCSRWWASAGASRPPRVRDRRGVSLSSPPATCSCSSCPPRILQQCAQRDPSHDQVRSSSPSSAAGTAPPPPPPSPPSCRDMTASSPLGAGSLRARRASTLSRLDRHWLRFTHAWIAAASPLQAGRWESRQGEWLARAPPPQRSAAQSHSSSDGSDGSQHSSGARRHTPAVCVEQRLRRKRLVAAAKCVHAQGVLQAGGGRGGGGWGGVVGEGQ